MTHGDGDSPLRVLLVDPDRDLAEVVVAILTDEGYEVEVLDSTEHDAITAAVGRLEPDCVLLEGTGPDYGPSWVEAAALAARRRAVPTIMFTAHSGDLRDAREGSSERAVAAAFAAILPKPFSMDELLQAVATATGRSERFDHSAAGDQARTEELERALADAGATDIRTSTRREWATFRSPNDENLHQIYWWQQSGLYMVGHYDRDARLTTVGRFFEREAAIAAALGG